jgi:hypothetical protein
MPFELWQEKWLGTLSPPTFQEMRYPEKFSSKEQKGDDRDDRPIDDAYCEKHRRILSAHEKPRRNGGSALIGDALAAGHWPPILLDEPGRLRSARLTFS